MMQAPNTPTPFSHLPLIITILTFLTFSLKPSFSAKLCNPNDKKALLEIQTHFELGQTDTWDATTDCCTWDIWYASVKCNSNGRVTGIYIQATLSGPIPAAFGDLTYLESLRVWPELTGTIPSSFSKLVHLQSLDLSLNTLLGPIPGFLGQLKSLKYLNLGNNGGVTGTIPPSLAQLPNLQSLYLYSNNLTGPIPGFLTRMKSLVELDLAGNSITGPIPPGLTSLPRLNYLNLGSCDIGGSIPQSMGYFKTSNITLNLNGNGFTGPIPKSLGRVNFQELRLAANNLTGDASFLFGTAKTLLTTIDISFNRLKFDFSQVELPQGIKDLDISRNKIYGSIPKKLGQLPLRNIDVSYNNLCGPIPNGRRLKNFSPDLFSNNKCLCGPPLPPCKE